MYSAGLDAGAGNLVLPGCFAALAAPGKLLYTSSMDRVRFGRALGVGARHAMKTLVAAADAATAENPSTKSAPRIGNASQTAQAPRAVEPSRMSQPGTVAIPATGDLSEPTNPAAQEFAPPTAAQKAAHTAVQGVRQARGVKHGLRRGLQEAWKPVARLSGVLWLEITGLLFGMLALSAAGAVWRLHGLWNTGRSGRWQVIGAAAMLALFSYFCVTSFVRARRRERQR